MGTHTYLINIDTPFINGNMVMTEETPMKAYTKYKEQLEQSNGKLGTKVMPYHSFIQCEIDIRKGSTVVIINPK